MKVAVVLGTRPEIIKLAPIIRILEREALAQEELGFPVVYPVHTRSRSRMKAFKIEVNGVRFIKPLDYLSFLQLESNAKLVLTDSGSVQEEACILGVPCVTLRHNTERPETLEVGSNVLAGTEPDEIVKKASIC